MQHSNTGLPDALEHDRDTITRILEERRLVSTETMPDDILFLWRTYLVILESALSTVGSLMMTGENRP